METGRTNGIGMAKNVMFFMFLLARQVPIIWQFRLVNYLMYAWLIGDFLLTAVNNRKNIRNPFVLWAAIFIAILLFSNIWTINTTNGGNTVTTLILLYLLPLSSLALSVRTTRDIECLMRAFILFAFCFTAIYIYDQGFQSIINKRLLKIDTEGWNINSIAVFDTIALFFCIYFLKVSRQKARYFTLIVVLLSIIVVTGTKKGFLLLGIFFWLRAIMQRKGSSLIIAGIVTFTAYFAIMNIPILYNTVGYRFVDMMSIFSDSGEADGSSIVRMKMIEFGWASIQKHPWLGLGADSFAYSFQRAYGDYAYAHNGSIELLFDYGIIGTAAYYWLPVSIALKAFNRKIAKGEIEMTGIAMTGAFLVNEMGMIGHYGISMPFAILMGYLVCYRNTQRIPKEASVAFATNLHSAARSTGTI